MAIAKLVYSIMVYVIIVFKPQDLWVTKYVETRICYHEFELPSSLCYSKFFTCIAWLI